VKTRITRKAAILATGAALALSLPIASSAANPGGVPNGGNGHANSQANGQSKPCPHKGHGTTKNINDLPSQARNHGKKCGFHKSD
jgi:hypothetical protein